MPGTNELFRRNFLLKKELYIELPKKNFFKKNFLYFRRELSELKKWKKKKSSEKISYIREMELLDPRLKSFYIFSEKVFLIYLEGAYKDWKSLKLTY